LTAVILAEVPTARVVELSHAIPPMSILDAEIALRNTAFVFPPETLHVVVVDPGVGTERRALAVRARDRFFIGPDNGVLGIAVREPGAEVVSLDKPDFWRHPVANTFHGRDIFAPVAAKIATGTPLTAVGTPIDNPQPSTIPAPVRKDPRNVKGITLNADRFGNLLTNIPVDLGDVTIGETWIFEIGGQIVPYRSTYMAAKDGRLIVTTGADRFLEVAVVKGSAAQALKKAHGVEIFCSRQR
jgi:hypothetical protein